MRDYIEKACDEIDASMFSGDAFHDIEHRRRLREYIVRWEHELNNIESTILEKI